MQNFHASGAVTQNDSAYPHPGIASGAIGRATAAGFSTAFLIPVLPPTITPGLETGPELKPDHLGKTPATFDRNSGLWRARKGWVDGVTETELEVCDQAGANAGLRLGMGPIDSTTYIFADFDTEPDQDPHSTASQVAAKICQIALAAIVQSVGRPVWVRETRPGRMGVLFLIAAGQHAGTKAVIHLNHGERGLGKLEVLARGQQVVIGGIHPHAGGTPIRWWRSDRPEQFQPAPSMTLEDFQPLASREYFNLVMMDVMARLERVGLTCTTKTTLQNSSVTPMSPLTAQEQAAPGATQLIELVDQIPHGPDVDYDSYINFMKAMSGCVRSMRALGRLKGSDEQDIGHAAARWAARWQDPNGNGADELDMQAKWENDFSKSPAERIGWGYIEGFAVKAGVRSVRQRQAQDAFVADLEPASAANENETSVEFSDDDLALRFADQQVGRLVHIGDLGGWHDWTGSKWRGRAKPTAFTSARALCRAEGKAIADVRLGRKVTSAASVAAVVSLASTDPGLAKKPADFDSDPMALNTPGGVVDLRTGELRQHRPGDLFLKEAGVAPSGSYPRWLRFLDEITQGDRNVIAYLKRWAGYALTGDICEHTFLFLYGPGGNGKSVFMDILSMVLGDYATPAMASVFTKSRNEAHSTEMAALQGARLVTLNEVDQGAEWDEARLKELTGGGEVKARLSRGDPFTFRPVFKLIIAGNHRPKLQSVGTAMRRRLHLLPLTFIPQKVDKGLPAALRAEVAGISAWCIEGCLEWQRLGLIPPRAVVQATEEYFSEADVVGNWIEARCEKDPNATVGAAEAYLSFCAFASAQHERQHDQKWFATALQNHFVKKRTKSPTLNSCATSYSADE